MNSMRNKTILGLKFGHSFNRSISKLDLKYAVKDYELCYILCATDHII